MSLRRLLLGEPLPTSHIVHERLSKVKALAVFSTDALSSSAYATEEILWALMLGGSVALGYSLPIALAIATLLVIVVGSYFQTIRAYPKGGGAYIVARENLGLYAGLLAAAALLVGYILTVAVSISAGVAAITSALPALYPFRVWLALGLITFIMLANLRGVRESGTLFSIPTYLFIFSFYLLIVVGLGRYFAGGVPVARAKVVAIPAVQPVTVFFILRAFASGCTALTGIEAISDGVPAFKPPEAVNASKTLLWMGGILASLFLGITVLSCLYSVVPSGEETVVSELARIVFGNGPLYYLIQLATVLGLTLAANTSFADFPRLSWFLARDRFLPRQLTNLGDRLVFSNGIILLGVLSSLLVIIFHGDTHALIPLYAVGVFVSFTLSQTGMVRRWLTRRDSKRWWLSAAINGLGALTSGMVMIIVAVTRFAQGAWIVVLLQPVIIAMFLQINRHYRAVAAQLSLEGFEELPSLSASTVVVPVAGVHRGVLHALQYARSISTNITAVCVDVDPAVTEKVREKWPQWVS
ncbi:MAG TPA: amino acid permease, partial [Anaerolineae bacterium]|nr:amino acid permease [Anaerolineae bacterium]